MNTHRRANQMNREDDHRTDEHKVSSVKTSDELKVTDHRGTHNGNGQLGDDGI